MVGGSNLGGYSLGKRTATEASGSEERGRGMVRDKRQLGINETSNSLLMNVLLKGEDYIEEQKSIDETSVKESKDTTPDPTKYR